MDWKTDIINHSKNNRVYTLRDLRKHLRTEQDLKEFVQMIRPHDEKSLREFVQTASDWQAFVPVAFMATIAQYGLIQDLPRDLITNVPESRDAVTKRFIWKSERARAYLEGESFAEVQTDGAAANIKWQKVAAKISTTREAMMDIPLGVVQMNLETAMMSFRQTEWMNFMHELHNGTSNLFEIHAELKNGEELHSHWNTLFDNAYDAYSDDDPYTCEGTVTWTDIKNARAKMVRRVRDAARPTVCIIAASAEQSLSDTLGINNAAFWGNSNTFFQTGALPPVYSLSFVVVPDALFGYFTDDKSRTDESWVTTNDAFLIATNNGPTILRHTREPMSTESWYTPDGQKQSTNIWERYSYSILRYTNIMRIRKNLCDEYGTVLD